MNESFQPKAILAEGNHSQILLKKMYPFDFYLPPQHYKSTPVIRIRVFGLQLFLGFEEGLPFRQSRQLQVVGTVLTQPMLIKTNHQLLRSLITHLPQTHNN